MSDEHREFSEPLTTLTKEIIRRVREVGLDQAAEEYWEKAKSGLHDLVAENEAFKKEHTISEDEL